MPQTRKGKKKSISLVGVLHFSSEAEPPNRVPVQTKDGGKGLISNLDLPQPGVLASNSVKSGCEIGTKP